MTNYKGFSYEALCLLLEERDAKIGRLTQQLSEAQFNYEDCRGECNRAEDRVADLQEQLHESRQNTAREIFKTSIRGLPLETL